MTARVQWDDHRATEIRCECPTQPYTTSFFGVRLDMAGVPPGIYARSVEEVVRMDGDGTTQDRAGLIPRPSWREPKPKPTEPRLWGRWAHAFLLMGPLVAAAILLWGMIVFARMGDAVDPATWEGRR